MDKLTRLLLLYSKLMQGEKISKLSFCLETDSLPRTFDRDIEDIRLYLSEFFYNEEVIYDRQSNIYYATGSRKKGLETMEYLFIERVLLDTGVLRSDEMNGLLTHLADNVEDTSGIALHRKQYIKEYIEPINKKAILKMHGDLATIIANKSAIKINYIKMNEKMVEREVIPCTIKYDLGYLYLIAFLRTSNREYPAYFRLDRIHSFSIIGSQKMDDIQRVTKYLKFYEKGITQMFGGEFIEILVTCKREFYPYIHDKFRDVAIVNDKDNILVVKLNAFEDGFIKWIMSQPPDLVHIIKPTSVKEKIVNEANRLLAAYKEVQKNGKEN